MDLMERRRTLMVMQTGGLPGAYQRVEYIASHGTEYIDTGVCLTNNSVVTVISFATSESIKRLGIAYGVIGSFKTTNSGIERFGVYGSDRSAYFYFGTWTKQGHGIANSDNARLGENVIICDKNGVTINGVSFFSTKDSTEVFTATTTAYIFGFHSGSQGFVNAGASQVTRIDIQDGQLQRHFVACYRKSDGEIGLYETVTKQFYTNEGTGSFEKGQDI